MVNVLLGIFGLLALAPVALQDLRTREIPPQSWFRFATGVNYVLAVVAVILDDHLARLNAGLAAGEVVAIGGLFYGVHIAHYRGYTKTEIGGGDVLFYLGPLLGLSVVLGPLWTVSVIAGSLFLSPLWKVVNTKHQKRQSSDVDVLLKNPLITIHWIVGVVMLLASAFA